MEKEAPAAAGLAVCLTKMGRSVDLVDTAAASERYTRRRSYAVVVIGQGFTRDAAGALALAERVRRLQPETKLLWHTETAAPEAARSAMDVVVQDQAADSVAAELEKILQKAG